MNETLLLASLGEYSEHLVGHLAVLRERHQELEVAWARLHEIYEGEGAQVFGEAFSAASARLAEYASGSQSIARQLHNKIEELRAFEAGDQAL